MSCRKMAVLLLAGLWVPWVAFGGDTATVKCLANQDLVWVYDSLNSFDVQAKLKCGEVVEITSRVKGFVKIKSSNGAEGWVPDSAFPGLPPLKDDKDLPVGLGSVPRTRTSAVNRPLVATTSEPAPQPISPIPPATNGIPPAAPPSAPPTAPPSAPAVVVLSASASASAPAPTAVSVTSPPPTIATAASSTKPTAAAKTTASSSRPANTVSASRPAPTPVTSKTAAAKAAAPPTSSSSAHGNASTSNNPGPGPKSAPTPTNNVRSTESTANVQPAREIPSIHPVAAITDSEDYPDFQPENESEDPACQVYFSAYGLAPSQFKWLAQNRKKRYPSICPAPEPSKVDFVLIFTHDEDVYASSLPVPVHTDKNGFSDFSPLMTVDTAMVSESAADKARRDYVWVFEFKRGAFDPGRFSPRRKPQFVKAESKSLGGSPVGPRTVEDALRYIEAQGPSR
jgi:hypothetical protein